MKIVQANVGRGSPAHDLLLLFEADIILVQESWIDKANQYTKTHPYYQLFSPATRWETRPRVLIYIRQDLPACSLPQLASLDIAAVCTAGLTIINVYHPLNNPVTPARSGSI
jgi:exonuclease III